MAAKVSIFHETAKFEITFLFRPRSILLRISRILRSQFVLRALVRLNNIYNKEGNRDEAYQLWKRALITNDNAPKDVVVCNLLEYDIQHGNTDNVLEKVNEIMNIKDSIQDKLKNDTLKDLQLRFDHEVEKLELDRKLDRSLWAIACLTALVIAFIIYVLFQTLSAASVMDSDTDSDRQLY